MPQDTPSRTLDQYIVRFPDGLRDRLKEVAKANGRSMNAEIVYRLELSLDSDEAVIAAHRGRPPLDSFDDVGKVDELIRFLKFQRELAVKGAASRERADAGKKRAGS